MTIGRTLEPREDLAGRPETERMPAAAAPAQHRVLCIGDMTVDLIAGPVRELPDPGEVSLSDEVACVPGGNALNTAIALRRLGEPVGFVGSLGDDPLGDLLVAQLEATGLDLRGVRREPGGQTPTTLIYRREGEDRRFVHALGVAERFTGEPVPRDLIPEAGAVLAGGYLKLRAWSDRALADLFRAARERGSRTILNVCIPGGAGVDVDRCLRLLPLVDVFVPNEDEARVLTGLREPAAQARALRDAGARWVIVTSGDRGLLADDGERVHRLGVYPVEARDPCGCGDCFSAGLIAALLRGDGARRALEVASAAAACSVRALGATTGVPSLAELDRFVSESQMADGGDAASRRPA